MEDIPGARLLSVAGRASMGAIGVGVAGGGGVMQTERETLLVVAERAEVGAWLRARLRAEGYRVVVARDAGDVDVILGGLVVDALVVGEDGARACRLGERADGLPVIYVGGGARTVAAQLAARTRPGRQADA